jgi:hypothetical protein
MSQPKTNTCCRTDTVNKVFPNPLPRHLPLEPRLLTGRATKQRPWGGTGRFSIQIACSHSTWHHLHNKHQLLVTLLRGPFTWIRTKARSGKTYFSYTYSNSCVYCWCKLRPRFIDTTTLFISDKNDAVVNPVYEQRLLCVAQRGRPIRVVQVAEAVRVLCCAGVPQLQEQIWILHW